MAELLFKRGLHKALSSTTIIDGAFYLTTDSHRLYAGIGSELVDLNKSITTVANVSALTTNNITPAPQDGDFAYAISENVLAVYVGGAWKQINKNTDTKNASLVHTGSGSTLTTTLTDSAGGKVHDTIVFTGTSGITVALDANGNVTIDGVKHSLETAFANNTFSVTLANDANDETNMPESSFALTKGANIGFSESNGNLTISAVDTTNAAATIGANTNGDLTMTITDSAGTTVTATGGEKKLYYKVGSATKTTVYNGNDLNVYTISEIDTKFNQLNAMRYAGTVASDADLASKEATAQNGDTFMVAEGGTYDGRVAKAGDLFIAQGEEDANGVLKSVTWTYVPSGDDAQTDTKYVATADAPDNGGTMTVVDTVDSNTMMKIDLEGDDKIQLDSTVSSIAPGSNNVLATKFSHAAPGAAAIEPTTGSAHNEAISIIVPTDFVIDSTGHVASYKEEQYNLAGFVLSGATVTAPAANKAQIVDTLKRTDGSAAGTSTFTIDASAADNLNVSVSGTTITMKLEWGTF